MGHIARPESKGQMDQGTMVLYRTIGIIRT